MRNSRSLKTCHGDIFDFWKDKAIDKYGNIEIEGKCDYENTIAVINDWGEPECWACGRMVSAEDDQRYLDYLEKGNFKNIWNLPKVKSGLNRCHIIPHMLGGSDNPNNLFLMCERCHKESPDIQSKKMFLRWVYHRRKRGTHGTEILLYVLNILKEDYGINAPLGEFDFDDAWKYIGLHGGTVSKSSIILALVLQAIEHRIQLEEEEMFIKALNFEIERRDNSLSQEDKYVAEGIRVALEMYKAFKKMEVGDRYLEKKRQEDCMLEGGK